MVRLDLADMNSREVNRQLKELIKTEAEIELDHPHSLHNFATALIGKGMITVHGSTGFYTGGFLEGPTIRVNGNTGWYTGDMLCTRLRRLVLADQNRIAPGRDHNLAHGQALVHLVWYHP